MEAVPATRCGRVGTQPHRNQAPIEVAIGCAMAPATKAQYPHPFQPRIIDTLNETTLAKMSLADTIEKRRARFRRARCRTDVLVITIVRDIPAATCATRGSP